MSHEDAVKLQLVTKENDDARVVVISHDCDLPNDKEEMVEVIVGAKVTRADGTYLRARHPRILHLCYQSAGGGAEYVEISHAGRKSVPKPNFPNTPEKELTLPPEEKLGLKQWLAARYARPAFPNAFENRIREKGLERKIAKKLEPSSDHLVGVFFDLGEDRTEELPPDTPYFLRILVAYDATDGGREARLAAEAVAGDLQSLFVEAFGPPATATGIAIESCTAVADTHIPLSDLRKIDQWRVEYISLKEDPPGDFLGAAGLVG